MAFHNTTAAIAARTGQTPQPLNTEHTIATHTNTRISASLCFLAAARILCGFSGQFSFSDGKKHRILLHAKSNRIPTLKYFFYSAFFSELDHHHRSYAKCFFPTEIPFLNGK